MLKNFFIPVYFEGGRNITLLSVKAMINSKKIKREDGKEEQLNQKKIENKEGQDDS